MECGAERVSLYFRIALREGLSSISGTRGAGRVSPYLRLALRGDQPLLLDRGARRGLPFYFWIAGALSGGSAESHALLFLDCVALSCGRVESSAPSFFVVVGLTLSLLCWYGSSR